MPENNNYRFQYIEKKMLTTMNSTSGARLH